MSDTERDRRLDILATGVKCHACGAQPDEPCRTRRTGRETLPHMARISRACDLRVARGRA
jgi:hypothetical protein